MQTTEIPRHILPERGQYVCPGSMFIRATDGRCLCGHPLGAHVWTQSNGMVRRVTDTEQAEWLQGTNA